MRNGLLTTLLILLCCQAAVAEEVVYVHDQLRLGVRALPDMGESSIAVVSTGDALTVLQEEENFIKVRTEGGVEGWVSKGYVSTEPPARLQLSELQAAHKKLQQEGEALQKQQKEQQLRYQKLQQEFDGLQARLNAPAARQDEQAAAQPGEEALQAMARLEQENAELKVRLEEGQNDASSSAPVEGAGGVPWTITMVLLLFGLVGGAIGGVQWKTRRVAERIGGLQI